MPQSSPAIRPSPVLAASIQVFDLARGRFTRYVVVLLGLIISTAGIAAIAFSPKLAVDIAPLEHFIPLDAGWRILNGFKPSLDFPSPIGPSWSYLVALAMAISGPSPTALLTADALAAIIAGSLLAGTSYRRCPASGFALAIVFTTFSCITGRQPDLPAASLTQAAHYTHWAWAFCTPLVVWLSADPSTRGARILGGICASSCIAILVLLKANFVIFAYGALGLSFWQYPKPRSLREVITVGSCGTLAAVMFLAILSSPSAYLADIVDAGRHVDWSWRLTKIGLDTYRNAGTIAAVLACAYLARNTNLHKHVWITTVLLVLTIAINNQNNDNVIPELGFALFPLAIGASRDFAKHPRLAILVWLVLVGNIGDACYREAPSIIAQARISRAMVYRACDSAAGPFADLILPNSSPNALAEIRPGMTATIYPGRYATSGEIATWLNDSVAALRRLGLAHRRIATSLYANPFPLWLMAAPPRATALWWDPNRSYDSTAPDADRLFADTEVLVTSKIPLDWTQDRFQSTFGPWLKLHGDLVYQDAMIEIWRLPPE